MIRPFLRPPPLNFFREKMKVQGDKGKKGGGSSSADYGTRIADHWAEI